MARRSPRVVQRRRPKATLTVASPRSRLERILDQQERPLTYGAIGAGLGRLRPRSPPGRLQLEALSFLSLVRAALRPRSQRFAAGLPEQIRSGAFAAADPADIPRLFALWREVIEAALPRVGWEAEVGLLGSTLTALELRVRREVRRDAQRRIDVIALCASAGGLKALAQVLSALEPELPVTVLVLLHGATPAAPIPSSWVRATRLSLAPAVEGSPLLLGCAYVARAGRHLLVEPDRLRLVDTPPVRFVRPSADVLLASAARSLGARLASAVLSGSGSDGAAGTREVRANGGVTFAQEPASAEFPGMPAAAIATGAVQFVLPLGALGAQLRRLIKEGRPLERRTWPIPRGEDT